MGIGNWELGEEINQCPMPNALKKVKHAVYFERSLPNCSLITV
ncbi:MAG: hypothetical protein V7K98_19905 [Nostoc sp.]